MRGKTDEVDMVWVLAIPRIRMLEGNDAATLNSGCRAVLDVVERWSNSSRTSTLDIG